VLKAFLQENGMDIKAKIRRLVLSKPNGRKIAPLFRKMACEADQQSENIDSLYLQASATVSHAPGTRKDGASTEVYITHRGMEEMVPADVAYPDGKRAN